MKKELNQTVVVVILAAAVGAIGGIFWWKTAGMYPIQADSKSMPMPKEAAEGMAKTFQRAQEQRKADEAARNGGGQR